MAHKADHTPKDSRFSLLLTRTTCSLNQLRLTTEALSMEDLLSQRVEHHRYLEAPNPMRLLP